MKRQANTQRALIAVVEVLGLCVWFSAAAVAPSLRSEWAIGATAAAWLTASVQIGFVAGAVISSVFNLADRGTPQKLLAVSALSAAACTGAVTFVSTGLGTAIALRFLTGMFLAGVYPVGMKLMASWSESANRGSTFGVLLGALTLGSALPHLVAGLGALPWRGVLLVAGALGVAGALIAVALVRPGPHLDVGGGSWNPRQAIAIFVERRARLVTLGYLGHMWELYALWTWLSMYIVAGRLERGETASTPTEFVTFAAIGVAGALGCLVGGRASDRLGRRPVAVAALVVSGSCCAASPLVFASPTIVLVVFLLLWGAAVIADSGVFSTALSETIDPRFVGTALTAQTAAGFLLTVLTIQAVPVIADLFGWRYAFLILAPGPLLGGAAMSAFTARQHHQHQEEIDHDHIYPSGADRGTDGSALTYRS